MNVIRYENPEDLPIDIEEAEKSYYSWLADKVDKLSSAVTSVAPYCSVTPVVDRGGGPTKYFVTGGVVSIY